MTMHEIDEIRASGVVDDDDLDDARLMGQPRSGRFLVFFGLAVGFVVAVLQAVAILREEGIADGFNAWLLATVTAAGIAGLTYGALRLRHARRRNHRVTGARIEYVFRPTGVEISDPWTRGSLPWSAFVGWNYSRRSFWLCRTPEVRQVLPKRFLEEGDVARLETRLRQSLGEPGRLRPAATDPRPLLRVAEDQGAVAASGDVIACEGLPQFRDWQVSRPAAERYLEQFQLLGLTALAVVALLLAVLVFSGLARTPETRQKAVAFLAASTIGLFLVWRYRRAVRSTWEDQRVPVSYRLSPRGLVLESGPETVAIAWNELESWRETRRTWVFHLGGRRWYFLPRRFLGPGGDRSLRSWLDSGRQSVGSPTGAPSGAT